MEGNVFKTIETGSIILINKKGADAGFFLRIFCALQRFFTKQPFTHCALVAFRQLEGYFALSVEELVTLRQVKDYFNFANSDVYIYNVKAPTELKAKLISEQIKNYLGQSYGYPQLLWFVYRWVAELFNIDVRNQCNWFTNGKICSESVYNYLSGLNIPELQYDLDEYNENTCNVGDIDLIIGHHPEYFELIYSNKHFVGNVARMKIEKVSNDL